MRHFRCDVCAERFSLESESGKTRADFCPSCGAYGPSVALGMSAVMGDSALAKRSSAMKQRHEERRLNRSPQTGRWDASLDPSR